MEANDDTAIKSYYPCLYVILDALQWRGHKSYIAKICRGSPDNMQLNDLLNSLATLKIEGKRAITSLYDLRAKDLPCLIVPAKSRPFIITQERDGKLIAFDSRSDSFVELPRNKKNLEVIKFIKKEREDKTLFDRNDRWFIDVLKRFKHYGLYILGLSTLINLLNIFAPLLVIIVFQQIAAAKSLSQLATVLHGLGIYLVALTLIRLIRAQMLNHVATRLGYIISTQVMRRILYLPSAYTEVASVGSQLARIKDFDTIQQFIPSMGTDALLDLPFTVLILFALFMIAGPLALVPLISVVIFIAAGVFLKTSIQRVSGEASKTAKERHDFVMDSLNSLEQLQTQHLTGFWQERYAKLAARASQKIFEAGSINSFVSALSYFVVTVSGVTTVIVGVNMVMEGSLDSAHLMTAMLLTWKVLAPLRNGFSFAMQIDKVKNSIQQVDRLMNIPLEYASDEAYSNDSQIKGHLSFQQVSLKYSTDAHPALLGVNFTVEAGETLVILGHGGSGQTSIFKLILGLYFPQAGRILIDNHSTKQMDPVALRQQIAYMSEHIGFFNGSIIDNLRLCVPGVDDEQIKEVLVELGLQAEIDTLPDGIQTRIETLHEGATSNSFLRRLNFSTMLLKKSRLWLLDNPGFGLDDQHEKQLLATLSSLRGRATIVIATKNTEYLNICDKVLWLNAGRVQFFGTPAEMTKVYSKNAA